MGPTEGQSVKVLLCDTRERKKVGDLVMWRLQRLYQSCETESLLIQRSEIHLHIFL